MVVEAVYARLAASPYESFAAGCAPLLGGFGNPQPPRKGDGPVRGRGKRNPWHHDRARLSADSALSADACAATLRPSSFPTASIVRLNASSWQPLTAERSPDMKGSPRSIFLSMANRAAGAWTSAATAAIKRQQRA